MYIYVYICIYMYIYVYMYICMCDVYTKKPSALQLLPVFWLVEVKILRMPAVATPTDVQRKTLSSLVIPLILLIGFWVFYLGLWKKLTCLCYIGNQTTIQFYNMDQIIHYHDTCWFFEQPGFCGMWLMFFSLLNFFLSFLMIQILNPKSRSFAAEGFLGHGVCSTGCNRRIEPSRCK